MPDPYLQGKLALASTETGLTDFREDFACSSAQITAGMKSHNPSYNNLRTPESFLTTAHYFCAYVLFRDTVVSKHMQQ